VTEADLRAAFTPYGPIHSIHFPTAPSTSSDNKKPLARGFAFVWFLAKKDAENALEGVNGSRIYAGLATEKANAAKGKKKEKKKKVEEGDVEEKKVEEPVVEKKEEKGRIVAVDWALSKERWLEAAGHGDDGKDADGANDEESGDEEEEEEETIGVHEEGSSDSDSDSSGSHDGDAEDDDDDKMDVDQKSGPPPPPPEGSTIFVRNVPFEATDSDLKDLSVIMSCSQVFR
jgi:nucleolar protein 4